MSERTATACRVVRERMNEAYQMRGRKIEDIMAAHPQRRLQWCSGHPSIEDTGRGDTLCYEAWGGRLFYSDPEAVKEAVDKWIEDYNEMCRKSEEDPANAFMDVTNFNDLYSLLGILPTHLGDAWGYNSSIDYARDLIFRVEMIYPTENEIADLFGCQILVIEPYDDSSYPDYYYRET